jgi:integrase
MIIAALDTGMRRGEMLALRFGDIAWKRMITLRGATTKSRRTRLVPIERVDVADVAQLISPETAPARD